MQDAVRNKEMWKRRRTPTQDPSTEVPSWFAQAAAELDSDEEPAEAPVDMDDPDLDAVRPASKMRLGLC